MLIHSGRHIKGDLDIWADHQEADIEHAKSAAFQRKVDYSLSVLESFVASGECYLGISWGKDSVVCGHLLWRVSQHVPVFHIVQIPGENPHNEEVRSQFLGRCPFTYRELVADYRGISGTEHEIDLQTDRVFFAQFKSIGIVRHISGIRQDESGGRRIRMRRWGLESANALAPIGYWTAQDVFSYLASHDLPVHPNYAMTGGGRWNRDRIRLCRIGGMPARGFGRLEWEQEYYGDVLRRMERDTLGVRASIR